MLVILPTTFASPTFAYSRSTDKSTPPKARCRKNVGSSGRKQKNNQDPAKTPKSSFALKLDDRERTRGNERERHARTSTHTQTIDSSTMIRGYTVLVPPSSSARAGQTGRIRDRSKKSPTTHTHRTQRQGQGGDHLSPHLVLDRDITTTTTTNLVDTLFRSSSLVLSYIPSPSTT